MNYLQKFFGHLKTILIHKYWVMFYSYYAGILWQGITHDLSKFSPIEFFTGIKYYTGYKSPNDIDRIKNGYSAAWLHHKGRNKHHYQYWTDNFDNGGEPIQMPFKYAVEMVCDFLAASRTYLGEAYSPQLVYKWWRERVEKRTILMHPQTIIFIDLVMFRFKDCRMGNEVVVIDRDNLEEIYNKATELYENLKELWEC